MSITAESIMHDPTLAAAIITVAASSIFFAIGLIRGSIAQRRANRIHIAKRLADVSMALSHNLVNLGLLRQECLREIRHIERHQSGGYERLQTLKNLLARYENEQITIDEAQDAIDRMFGSLEKARPEDIEMMMKGAYSQKLMNESTLKLLSGIRQLQSR